MTKLPDLYPAEFPIKVMGRNDGTLKAQTQPIIERHAGALVESMIRERLSADGNFVSLTYVIEAQSREQLDAIYRELTALSAVLMAL
jgi:putative lipoic acid-binding regulatory protein